MAAQAEGNGRRPRLLQTALGSHGGLWKAVLPQGLGKAGPLPGSPVSSLSSAFFQLQPSHRVGSLQGQRDVPTWSLHSSP